MRNDLLIGLIGYALITPMLQAAEIKADLGQFQAQCQISLNEPWRTIPWETSLLVAQKLAAQEMKPIYIWAMDGHPLGCT